MTKYNLSLSIIFVVNTYNSTSLDINKFSIIRLIYIGKKDGSIIL